MAKDITYNVEAREALKRCANAIYRAYYLVDVGKACAEFIGEGVAKVIDFFLYAIERGFEFFCRCHRAHQLLFPVNCEP